MATYKVTAPCEVLGEPKGLEDIGSTVELDDYDAQPLLWYGLIAPVEGAPVGQSAAEASPAEEPPAEEPPAEEVPPEAPSYGIPPSFPPAPEKTDADRADEAANTENKEEIA